jgi:hypothetical protein
MQKGLNTQAARSGRQMKRRRFLFWVGFGLFSLGEKLRVIGLDELAAATLKDGDTDKPVHWRAAGNSAWQWYERETLVDGKWKVSGITTPINRETGELYTEKTGYLDEHLVPPEMRAWALGDDENESTETKSENVKHLPSPQRKARHGRPPSKWLRSLNADELRIWLATVEVTESGVSGMTYFTHLTRDHFFDGDKITGLTEDEQAKLHGAAHDGY